MSQIACLPLPKKPKGKNRARNRKGPGNDEGGDSTANNVEAQQDLPHTGSTIESLEKMDAMSYLASVHLEAQSLPRVFVSESAQNTRNEMRRQCGRDHDEDNKVFVPIDGSASVARLLVSHVTTLPPCPSQNLPKLGQKWVDATLADFSGLRGYMEQCASAGVGQKRGGECFSNMQRVPVPPMKEGNSWHEFCLGPHEAHGNVGGYFDDSDRSENELSSDQPPWRVNLSANGKEPSLALLLQMDQVLTRRVLAHHVGWVVEEGYEMTQSRGAWMYALLARMEKPLHSEDQATLRRLLRWCCGLRGEAVSTEREEVCRVDKRSNVSALLAILNVLIVVVGIYFEQGPSAMKDDAGLSTSS